MLSKLQRLRASAFEAQSGQCYYCGVRMWLREPKELAVPEARAKRINDLRCTAEHLLARSEGGRDVTENVVAACLRCNRTRHRLSDPPKPAVYRGYVQQRVRRGGWHLRWVSCRGLLCCND